jgi:hypothetical protein
VSAPASGRKQVALVWTEFQENVLLSVMKATAVETLDLLFVRDTIAECSQLKRYARRTVIVRDIDPSYRKLRETRQEIVAQIDSSLPEEAFQLWLSNYEHIYGRRLMFHKNCTAIRIFEEGACCYVDFKFLKRLYGFRAFVSTLLLKLCYLDYGGFNLGVPRKKVKDVWSFFPGCFPLLGMPQRLIDHGLFESVLRNSVSGCGLEFSIDPDAALYLPVSLSDTNFVSEEIDYRVNQECIAKFLGANPRVRKIVWKPHPRAIMAKELARVRELSGALGVSIRCIEDRVNFEKFIFQAKYHPVLPVFSTMSSSLFVAKALEHRGLRAVSVTSKTLLEVEKVAPQVYEVFRRIGIVNIG